jgi:CO/xanthine dehydrogenase FAD-binding subunit
MDLPRVTSVRTPRSRDELALQPGEAFLGGGTWLFSEPQPGITGLVDLTSMGWKPLAIRDDGALRIASTCTLERLHDIPPELGGRAHPVFRQAVRSFLAGFKVWHVATVGGNLCFSVPAGPIPVLACVLDASIAIWGPDRKRRVPAAEFVTGVLENALGPGELVRAIDVPATALAARTAWRKLALSPLGRAGVFVAARLEESGRFAVAIGGSLPRPRVLDFERMPAAGELAEAVAAIGGWYEDPHGSAPWRRAMSLRLAAEVRDELAAGDGDAEAA